VFPEDRESSAQRSRWLTAIWLIRSSRLYHQLTAQLFAAPASTLYIHPRANTRHLDRKTLRGRRLALAGRQPIN
jgi:hypothetical protein